MSKPKLFFIDECRSLPKEYNKNDHTIVQLKSATFDEDIIELINSISWPPVYLLTTNKKHFKGKLNKPHVLVNIRDKAVRGDHSAIITEIVNQITSKTSLNKFNSLSVQATNNSKLLGNKKNNKIIITGTQTNT